MNKLFGLYADEQVAADRRGYAVFVAAARGVGEGNQPSSFLVCSFIQSRVL